VSDRPSGLSGASGHPRADPQHQLPGAEQEALEAAVDVAAILQREAQLTAAESVRPGAQLAVAFLRAGHGQLAEELAGGVFDCRRGVGVFVGVDADRDHLSASQGWGRRQFGSAADRTGWG
jgi:hypothetical protein